MQKKFNLSESSAKKLLVILSIVIIVFVPSFLSIYVISKKNPTIQGTYSTNSNQPDGYYYVFQPDGKYFQYKQFKMLEKGTYFYDVHNNTQIITLSENQKQIIYSNETIFVFDSYNTFAIYEKISKQSLFINVSVEE